MSSIRAEMSGDTDALLQRLNKLKSLENAERALALG